MKTILVTGATGFFGTSFLQALLQTDGEYTAVCTYFKDRPTCIDPRITWIEQDLLDISTHEKLFQEVRPTDFVHLAWYVPPQQYWHSLKNIEWMYASASLFEQFCAVEGKVFVGAGSLAEYDWAYDTFDEDTTPLRPHTLYGQSKKSLFELLRCIRDTKSPNTLLVWPRIGYFFGENEPQEKFLSRLLTSIKQDTVFNVMSRETQRPYAHVDYVGIILNKVLKTVKTDVVFNLACPYSYSIEEIINYAAQELKKDVQHVRYGGYKPPTPEPIRITIPGDKLRKILDFEWPDTFFKDFRKCIQKDC